MADERPISARFAAAWRLVAAWARRDPNSPLVFHRNGIAIRRWRTACRLSGATQRCLNPGCSKRIGNSRRTGLPHRSATGAAPPRVGPYAGARVNPWTCGGRPTESGSRRRPTRSASSGLEPSTPTSAGILAFKVQLAMGRRDARIPELSTVIGLKLTIPYRAMVAAAERQWANNSR